MNEEFLPEEELCFRGVHRPREAAPVKDCSIESWKRLGALLKCHAVRSVGVGRDVQEPARIHKQLHHLQIWRLIPAGFPMSMSGRNHAKLPTLFMYHHPHCVSPGVSELTFDRFVKTFRVP